MISIVTLVVLEILLAVLIFVIGFYFGARSAEVRYGKGYQEIDLDENKRFMMNGHEYELMSQDEFNENNYEVIEEIEVDPFGVPLIDKKNKKPN